jgi:hypothetical protein
MPPLSPERKAKMLEGYRNRVKRTLSPRCPAGQAIRYRCLDCLGEMYDAKGNLLTGFAAVRNCDLEDCALHGFRMGYGKAASGSRIKAIRKKCLECCCDQYKEIELCPTQTCSLYEFRFGRNPTDAEIAAVQDVKIFGRDKELWNPTPIARKAKP